MRLTPTWWNVRSPRYWLVVVAAAPVGLLLGALLTTQFAQPPDAPASRVVTATGGVPTARAGIRASPAADAPQDQARNAAFVRAVYQDTIGAAPAQDALDGWLRALAGGVSREQVAAAILSSPEYGGVIEEQAFQRLLGRTAGGGTDWAAALKNGSPPEQLYAGVLGSDEFYQHTGGTDRGWLTALYKGLLGRDPAPGELDSQLATLARGAGRYDIAYGLTLSDEYRRRFLDAVFRQYLGRPPTDGELRWLTAAMAAGQTSNAVRAALLGSGEYLRRHAPA